MCEIEIKQEVVDFEESDEALTIDQSMKIARVSSGVEENVLESKPGELENFSRLII